MPPKKTSSEMKSEQRYALVDAFAGKYDELRELERTPNIDPNVLKQALKDLEPHMVAADEFIQEINKTTTKKNPMSTQTASFIALLNLRVGRVYISMGHYEKARNHLKDAIHAGFSLVPYDYMALLEYTANRPKDLRKAQEKFLSAALETKYANEVPNCFSDLKAHALGLLQTYLKDPKQDTNLDNFFAKYLQFLGVDGYIEVIEFYNNQPELQARWREKLLSFITHQPNAAHPQLNCFYEHQASYFLMKKKYAQCFHFIEKNIEKFSPEQLSTNATELFAQVENTHELNLSTIKSWLTQAAETGSKLAVAKYLYHFAVYEDAFSPDKALPIINSACEQKVLAGLAHHVLAIHHERMNNEKASFASFQRAVDCGHQPALIRLAHKYAMGLGTTPDPEQAEKIYDQAHQSGSDEAGIVWAEWLISTHAAHPIEKRREMILKASRLLSECETRSTEFLAYIALNKANCMLALDLLEVPQQTVFAAHGKETSLTMVQFAAKPGKKNPERIKALKFAAEHGTGSIQMQALVTLACSQFFGTDIDQDIVGAFETLHTALKINKTNNELNTAFEHCLLMLCGACLQSMSDNVSGPNKKTLQIKALSYFQEAMNCQGDEFSPIVKNLADRAYVKQNQAASNSAEVFRLFSMKLQGCSNDDWKKHLNQLKTLLSNPNLEKNPEKLKEITDHIQVINEHLLDDPSLFPILQRFVSDCVANPLRWGASEFLSVFANVSRWHLSAATAELAPLSMYYRPHFEALPFKEQCNAIKIIAQCNFNPKMQEDFLPMFLHTPCLLAGAPSCPPAGAPSCLLAGAEGPRHPKEAPPQYTIEEASRLFHTLALLDCNHQNPLYSTLAKQLFTNLKPIVNQAGDIEVSQLFHAYHYFRSYYPEKTWTLGADLRKHFDTYRSSQSIHNGLVSKNQEKIHELLESLLPQGQLKQEAFIELVGRRVDFLVGQNVIIQYNGTRFHNMWDNAGKRDDDSLKEKLCYKTLTAPNAKQQYFVLRIDRTTWANLKNDTERRNYLQSRLDTVSIKFREAIDDSERKVPFLGKPIQAKRPNESKTQQPSDLSPSF